MNAGRWLMAMECWLSSSALAAQSGLTPEDQAGIEFWLSIIGGLLFALILGLLALAVAIRYIAKHSTQPCRWCMEFIPRKATVCPRCGKSLERP
jgi:undecaprenyl pyrophosphate phosphatase UppP